MLNLNFKFSPDLLSFFKEAINSEPDSRFEISALKFTPEKNKELEWHIVLLTEEQIDSSIDRNGFSRNECFFHIDELKIFIDPPNLAFELSGKIAKWGESGVVIAELDQRGH